MRVEETKVVRVAARLLMLDPDVQVRAHINYDRVREYAADMANGDEFPPVIVYHRFGQPYYVADGFHRVLAARKAEIPTVECEVRDGTKRDAILYAVGANSSHGLRRTREDKRWAVLMMLEDPEWSKWSNSEVARRCRVSDRLVAEIRAVIERKKPKTRTCSRGGKEYQQTAEKKRAGRPPAVPEYIEPDEEICPYCHQPIPRGGSR
jgi:hypothetical protein